MTTINLIRNEKLKLEEEISKKILEFCKKHKLILDDITYNKNTTYILGSSEQSLLDVNIKLKIKI